MQNALDGDRSRSVHTVRRGSGPPVVFIHGALATHADWPDAVVDPIAARFEAILLDRPGHGGSPRARFEATPVKQAHQIRETLLDLGVERPVLVGHSFGGFVALAYAQEFPEDAAGLVLVSPLCFPEVRPVEHVLLAPRATPMWGPVFSLAAAVGADRVLLALAQALMFAPQPVPPPWRKAYPYADVLTPEHMVMEGEDTLSIAPASRSAYLDFSRIVAPAEIVVGDADLIARPDRHGAPASGTLRNASLTRLPGVGHMVHHVEPGVVLDAIARVAAAASPLQLGVSERGRDAVGS